MDDNAAALAFLKNYCHDARKLRFAVMVSGPWGIGKTHFITRFLEEEEIGHLYVSLYGLKNTEQIDDEFWRLCHPVLSSRPMKLLGAVAKGVLKGAVKVDLDGDKKEEGTWSPSIPEIVSKANPAGKVLVFDDLERCAMPIQEVLGYINALVEHSDFKVIILANEAKLLKQNVETVEGTASQAAKPDDYADIKEKLVGHTFEIRSAPEEALTSFLKDVAHDKAAKYLEKNRGAILAVYRLSGCENLRVLRHALWDFERFAGTAILALASAAGALIADAVLAAVIFGCAGYLLTEFAAWVSHKRFGGR